MTTLANLTLIDWLLLGAGLWLLTAPIVAVRLGKLLKRADAPTLPDDGLAVLGDAYVTLPIECLPRGAQIERLELLYRAAS